MIQKEVLVDGVPVESNKSTLDINGYKDLDIDYFHRFTKGEGVSIAVIDSEIDLSHAEFRNSDIIRKDFVESIQPNYHGTAISSLIVGNTLGIAPKAQVHHLKILSDVEDDGPAWAKAMHYIAMRDIDIVCMSIGTSSKLSLGMQEYLQRARYRGVAIVAPSGNEGMYAIRYPAGDRNVIAVGGLDAEGNVSKHSNTPRYIDLNALSDDVMVANIDKKIQYRKRTGTSFSNAIVAGQLALIKGYMRDNGVEMDMFKFVKEYKEVSKVLKMKDVKEFLDTKYDL